MDNFIRDNRQAAISILSIFMMIIIVLLGVTNIYDRIGNVRRKINTAQGELKILENKIDTLSDAQINSISDLANQASVTLPVDNPTLALVLNVRRINDSVGQFFIKNMEVGQQNTASQKSVSLNNTTISIEVTGTIEGLNSFIKEVAQLNPVTNIKTLIISRKFGARTLDAEMELISFWSPLPTRLSDIGQTIAGLTAREEEVLSQVSQFSQPSFGFDTTDVEFAPRENPFVLIE